jgi:hypothetical protein
MKFVVTRTSLYLDEAQPVEGAVKEEVTPYGYRINDFEKQEQAWKHFNENFTDVKRLPSGDWRGTRKEKEVVWVIEIDNIIEFIKKVGTCVVSVSEKYVEGYPQIEIYDDYRE